LRLLYIVMQPPTRAQPPADRAASLVKLMEENAEGDYIGESISILEHSLQCAHLAAKAGSDNETVLAALFHDVGQFLPAELLNGALEETDVGRPNHASTGAVYLHGIGFPTKVTNIVAQHVASKRYLTATDSAYMDQLSEASKRSLKQQGGPMSESELGAFEQLEGWRECLEVRKWDDQAKVVGVEHETPRAHSYMDIIAGVLAQSRDS